MSKAWCYKGYFLSRDVYGYIQVAPVQTDLPPLRMPFRSQADARNAIDRLLEGELQPQT